MFIPSDTSYIIDWEWIAGDPIISESLGDPISQ